MSEITDDRSTAAKPGENPGENRLAPPRPIRNLAGRWKDVKDREGRLTENERAKERMSDIARRLKTALDDPKFMNQEKNRYSHFPGIEPGIGYGVNTGRDAETGSVYMVEVYARPMDSQNYTSGRGNGYWRIYFHKDHSHFPNKVGADRIEWSNTSVVFPIQLYND